ncbi:MAG: hypothetical protein ACYC6C_02650 [Coriobacteriia bacterium]
MIFGFQLVSIHIIVGGILVMALLVLQLLVGTRRIKFKGPKHMLVHRRLAWAIFAVALLHGITALAYVYA